ncbi:hypothetical protein LUZ61_019080 [Rhynchospora tenuis]|uniref:BED-type domain-containing protein n=1 Tax=Rhynchospora tenuis TaxID=198213 RepID=A0AAD5ZAP5_9POAL|nr:hypothetical protein LUZ61_019080 [Rhynchospora tenuis]
MKINLIRPLLPLINPQRCRNPTSPHFPNRKFASKSQTLVLVDVVVVAQSASATHSSLRHSLLTPYSSATLVSDHSHKLTVAHCLLESLSRSVLAHCLPLQICSKPLTLSTSLCTISTVISFPDMTQSQASVVAETNDEEEVHVSSGSEVEKDADPEYEPAVTPSPTPTPAPSSENSSQLGEGQRQKRKRSSEVWLSFKNNNRGKVYCIHCKKHYKEVKGGTTTHLRRHLEGCVLYKRHQGKTAGLLPISENQLGDLDVGGTVWVNGKWDPVKDREMLAYIIVGHELPFMFSEYSLFRRYMLYNNPLWQKVSRTTITKECMRVVESERGKLKKVFKDVEKVSLTSDCWTSNRTVGYMCITTHYIDSDWNLQKRIITFKDLSPPHSGEVISDAILVAIRKWGIEDKIGTVTLDNASNNDKAASLLRFSFEAREKLHFQGYFFHIRCCAHILNLVVQDGLGKIDGCLSKIREGVKYLKKSSSRFVKFGEIATQLGICTKRSLCIDVKTRWNSTYHMLDVAIHYKLALDGYAQRDSNFEWLPDRPEWEKAEKAICDAYVDDDAFTRDMSMAMYEKFEKYWGEVNVLMVVASILDPRLKMVSVKFVYGVLYSRSEVGSRIDEVVEKLRALYDMYAKDFMSSSDSTTTTARVSSESAFSAGGRILDDYRSSLKENVVETMVCGGDWIRANTRAEMQTIEHAAKAEEDLTIKIPMSQLTIN